MRILCVGSGTRAEYLAAALIEANHSVSSVERVVDAAYLVAVEHIDAAIVLCAGEATDAARAMVARPVHTVLVIIDAPGNQDARIEALYAGADACFTGDYEYAELEARLHALWRDGAQVDADMLVPVASSSSSSLAGGPVLSRTKRSLIGADGTELPLTRREYLLMECLLRNAGSVVQRDELIGYVFGDAEADGVSLQRLVSALRRRIVESAWGLRLVTMPRVGYRLVLNMQDASEPYSGDSRKRTAVENFP
jgi:two-component system, OmpR family, response regulator